MADFKKITEVPVVEEPNEGDTLMIISDGELKQISASSFAASSGGNGGNMPVVWLNLKTTSGATPSGFHYTVYDPNNIGITTPAELYEYYCAGGTVMCSSEGKIIRVLHVDSADSSGSTIYQFCYCNYNNFSNIKADNYIVE